MASKKLTLELKEKMLRLREEHGLTYYALALRFGFSEDWLKHQLSKSKKGMNVSPDCR